MSSKNLFFCTFAVVIPYLFLQMKEFIIFITLFLGVNSFAQISVKTEYISNSKFYDAVSDSNIGDGSAMIYSVGALVPLSMKVPEEEDPYRLCV